MAVIPAVILLLCIAGARGGVKKGDEGGAASIDGIHDGRFLPEDVTVTSQAVFNQGGVSGVITFIQTTPSDDVQIHVSLEGLDQFVEVYRWKICQFPVRSSLLRDFPCTEDKLGGTLPTGNLTAVFGPIRYDLPWQVFDQPSDLTLIGPSSIVGRSLVIDRQDGPEGAFICANIEQVGVRREILRATFDNDAVHGDVVIRYSIGRDDAFVEADVHSINASIESSTGNTLTLNYGSPGPGNSCDNIGIVFGSESYIDAEFTCSMTNHRECILGDLSSKCGRLFFVDGRARIACSDSQLGVVPRHYIFNEDIPDHALLAVIRDGDGVAVACAQFEMVAALVGRSMFRSLTTFGDFYFWQQGPDDRTYIRAHLTGLNGVDYALRIFEGESDTCDITELGSMIFRQGGDFIIPSVEGSTTLLGNLDDLFTLEDGQQSLRTTVSTAFLPLFGPHTILQNTLALVEEQTGNIEACAKIERQAEYPPGELASLIGFQDINNPPLPPVSFVPVT